MRTRTIEAGPCILIFVLIEAAPAKAALTRLVALSLRALLIAALTRLITALLAALIALTLRTLLVAALLAVLTLRALLIAALLAALVILALRTLLVAALLAALVVLSLRALLITTLLATLVELALRALLIAALLATLVELALRALLIAALLAALVVLTLRTLLIAALLAALVVLTLRTLLIAALLAALVVLALRTLLITTLLATLVVLTLRALLIAALLASLVVLALRALLIAALLPLGSRLDAVRLIAAGGGLFCFFLAHSRLHIHLCCLLWLRRLRRSLGLRRLLLLLFGSGRLFGLFLHDRPNGLALLRLALLRFALLGRNALFGLRLALFRSGLFLGFLRCLVVIGPDVEREVSLGGKKLHQALFPFALDALLALAFLLFLELALGAAHVLKRIRNLALRFLYTLKKLSGLRLKLLCEIVDFNLCHSIITPVHIRVSISDHSCKRSIRHRRNHAARLADRFSHALHEHTRNAGSFAKPLISFLRVCGCAFIQHHKFRLSLLYGVFAGEVACQKVTGTHGKPQRTAHFFIRPQARPPL